MIRRLAVLLALLPSLAAAQVIRYVPPPGVAPVGGSFVANCIPYASSTTTLLCTPATSDGTNITIGSGQLLLPAADNCSTPPYSFTSDATTGFCSSAAGTAVLRAAGTNILKATSTRVTIGDYLDFGASGATNGGLYCPAGGTTCTFQSTNGSVFVPVTMEGLRLRTDVKLERDAANTLAQRNGTNVQTFRIYSTYNDASNYVRTAFGNQGIFVESAGTGDAANGDLYVASRSTSAFYFGNIGSYWYIFNGHLVPPANNTYDIGSSAGNKLRTIYAATGVTTGSARAQYSILTNFGASTDYAYWSAEAAGQVTLNPSTGTATSIRIGGTTSSFPALKRNGSSLQIRAADDSSYTGVRASTYQLQSGTIFTEASDGIGAVTDSAAAAGAFQFTERTAPAAGAANTARLYAKDNGAGKTQLCVLFATGAEQCFATEP